MISYAPVQTSSFSWTTEIKEVAIDFAVIQVIDSKITIIIKIDTHIMRLKTLV